MGHFPKLNDNLNLTDSMIQGTLAQLQEELEKANKQAKEFQKSYASICFEVEGADDPNEPIIQQHTSKQAKTTMPKQASTKKTPSKAKDQHTLT